MSETPDTTTASPETAPEVGLDHSEVRHRMLHTVATTPNILWAPRLPMPGRRYITTDLRPLAEDERQALADLGCAALILADDTGARRFDAHPVLLTTRGRSALDWWDAHHGPVAGRTGPAFDYPGTVRRLPDATVAVLRDDSHLGGRTWLVVRATPDTPTVLLADEHVAEGEVIGVVPGTVADLMAEVDRRQQPV
jgi:hypothetical protein